VKKIGEVSPFSNWRASPALHPTAIPLRFIVAGELGRYVPLKNEKIQYLDATNPDIKVSYIRKKGGTK